MARRWSAARNGVDELNAGGVLGYKFDIVVGDTKDQELGCCNSGRSSV